MVRVTLSSLERPGVDFNILFFNKIYQLQSVMNVYA